MVWQRDDAHLRHPRWGTAVGEKWMNEVENDMGMQLRALHLGLPDDAVMVQEWSPEAPAAQINQLVAPKAINAEEVPFNRRFRKRIQKATAVVLNLFCGPNPKWWEKKMPPGFEIINIDLLAGQDLLHDGLFSYLLQVAKEKRILAYLAGPPCRTVSVLRMRDDNGPRMLRSCNVNIGGVYSQCLTADLPEEPPTFSTWPELVDTLEGFLALGKILLDQGALGHARRKPTVLWSDMEAVVALHGLQDRRASQPWPSNLEEALNLARASSGRLSLLSLMPPKLLHRSLSLQEGLL
eukprot:s1246_g27.t1